MRNLVFLASEFFDRDPLPEPPGFFWTPIWSSALIISVIVAACWVLP